MVERLNDNQITLPVTIIPQLTKHNTITLTRGDTIIVHIENEELTDLECMEHMYKMFHKAFPYNQVMVVPSGVRVEVVKDESVEAL